MLKTKSKESECFWKLGVRPQIAEPISNFVLMGERKVRIKRKKRTDRCMKCSVLVTHMQERVIFSKRKVFSLYTGLSALHIDRHNHYDCTRPVCTWNERQGGRKRPHKRGNTGTGETQVTGMILSLFRVSQKELLFEMLDLALHLPVGCSLWQDYRVDSSRHP